MPDACQNDEYLFGLDLFAQLAIEPNHSSAVHMQDACQNDEYLFDLDHFVQLANEPSSDVDPQQLPPLPPSHQADADDDLHLVIDARTQGERLVIEHCFNRASFE